MPKESRGRPPRGWGRPRGVPAAALAFALAACGGGDGPAPEPAAAEAGEVVALDEPRYVEATAAVACASRRGPGTSPDAVREAAERVYARLRTRPADVAAFGAAVNASPRATEVGAAVMRAMAGCR